MATPQTVDGHEKTCPLGYQGAHGHTLDVHSGTIDQGDRCHQISHILHDRHVHRYARILHAYKPAGKTIQAHHGRGSPDADREVGIYRLGHIGLGLHGQHGQG